jgi:peptidyl-dipeptidase Dcp
MNPFFEPSPLPFEAPQFDKIRDSDFKPAFEEGMRRQLQQVDAIADDPAPPTFANTIVALERTGRLLTRVSRVFFALTSANTNDTLQRIETEVAPELAAHDDAIHLNAKLFKRVEAVYAQRASLHLDEQSSALLDRYHRDFVRAGAELSASDKNKLRALNLEESKLTTRFSNKLLAATKAGALVVEDRADLEGLSEQDVASAAQSAKARGLDGKWVLPLQNTTQQPAQASLRARGVRHRLFEASVTRAERGDDNDTRAVISRLAQLRAQKAALLGFANYADYALATQVAKTPRAALKLMKELVPATLAKARGEAARMQQLIDGQGKNLDLAAWDWQYYAERLREKEYALDESKIRPYFELDTVLRDGVFYAAHELYGLTFEERHDLPVYAPGVRVFEVFDADGKPLALFYADYSKRDNKSGGAWMNALAGQSGLFGQKAVVTNVANFTPPAPGQPALLSFDDVATMFHEFGHALHGMFSDVKYPTLAGTNVPRDFVEFPSQFNEHWALNPDVLAHYAKHYETHEPMPQELVDKIKKSQTFNQGFAMLEYLEAALLDMAWHTLPADAPRQDPDRFELAALKRFGVYMPSIPPRYHSSYFAHIWDGGYAAGYYAYVWSEVMDDDAYAWFEDHGGLTRANGQRFREMILSRGDTEDEAAMYREFSGHDPRIDPLLEDRGLTDDTP